MKHTIQEDNWRERFDKEFSDSIYAVKRAEHIKSFISSMFASQLQSILSEVEKLPSYNMEVSSFGHTESALNREQVLSIISNRMGEKI